MKKICVLIGMVLGMGCVLFYNNIHRYFLQPVKGYDRQFTYGVQPVLDNKSCVVIVLGNEEGTYCTEELLSVASQSYSASKIIYITRSLQEASLTINDAVHVLQVTDKTPELEHIYRELHACEPDALVVVLRAGERFAHQHVLREINRYFADPELWMASFGSLQGVPLKSRESGCDYQVFYAGIFHHIPLEQCVSNTLFKASSYYETIMPGMIDLCGMHAKRIPQVLTINTLSPIESIDTASLGYQSLTGISVRDVFFKNAYVDMVVFSDDHPMHLYACLESVSTYISGLHDTCVIYHASNDHYEQEYMKIKKAFPDVKYLRYSALSTENSFNDVLNKSINDKHFSFAEYILFTFDHYVAKSAIDLEKSVSVLQDTGAYGCYFSLGTNVSSYTPSMSIKVNDGFYAFAFANDVQEWNQPHSLGMTLFNKNKISASLGAICVNSPTQLNDLWEKRSSNALIGVHCEIASCLNVIPSSMQSKESHLGEHAIDMTKQGLLNMFHQGYKLNVKNLESINNENITVDDLEQVIR